MKRSLLTRRDEITKGEKYLSFFLHFYHKTYTRKTLLLPEMSNPVVFFDMEIGGQPAGRIEMTVRICVSFLSLLCKVFPSSSRESARCAFSLSDDDRRISRSLFSNQHQPAKKATTTTIFFVPFGGR